MKQRFTSSDWLIVGGGLLLLAASRFAWWTVEWDGGAASTSTDAFDYGTTGILPLVILLLVGVLAVIVKTDSLDLPSVLVHPFVTTSAVLLAAVLVAVRFLWSGYSDTDGVSRGIGLYLAAAGVVIALIGCGLAIRDLRRSPTSVDPGDEFVDEDADDYYDDDEDDLVQRFNMSLSSGEVPVTPSPDQAPPRRIPTGRQRASRRRPGGRAEGAAPRPRRRPAGPPLP